MIRELCQSLKAAYETNLRGLWYKVFACVPLILSWQKSVLDWRPDGHLLPEISWCKTIFYWIDTYTTKETGCQLILPNLWTFRLELSTDCEGWGILEISVEIHWFRTEANWQCVGRRNLKLLLHLSKSKRRLISMSIICIYLLNSILARH